VNVNRLLLQLGALVASLAALLLPNAALSANSAPAIAAFDRAFASTSDYTCILHVHEAKGGATQDRVYQYSFMKPHYARTLILDGDGKGSGGVWIGGDQISGHQGGILSGFHRKVDVHDPRAVSLRGVTIPEGLLQRIVELYESTPGKLTQSDGGKIGGASTDRLELIVTNPAANSDVTKQILYLSKDTHWPIRQILYSGSQIVLDETVSDLKTNTGLTQADFPF
jgi:outer membrane lipoprotein-sorting protein